VLVLRGSRHSSFPRQISQEFRHFRFRHLTPFIVKKNEAPDPVHICLFGSDAKMFASNHVPNLIEQFRLVRVSGADKVTAMSGIFDSLTLQGKRIRPEKPVIKGGIFPPNPR
jgi:hypothetical protein